jgi:hypothetical protein
MNDNVHDFLNLLAAFAFCTIALLIALDMVTGCSGPQTSEGSGYSDTAPTGEIRAETEATIELGIAVVIVQADAVWTDDEATVCATIAVTALGFLSVQASIAWDIREGTAHICGSLGPMQRCIEVGP